MAEYKTLYESILRRFREYFLPNGIPEEEYPLTRKIAVGIPPRYPKSHGRTQTALVLLLHFGLCKEEDRPRIAKMLTDMIDEKGFMETGFIGTYYLPHVLTACGRTDLAYPLLLREESPSWLYSVVHGATTVWEHWNSLKEDGSFWSTDMNSFNHYAYGAVFDWIFAAAVGIAPTEDAPGYEHIVIAPHPHKALGFVDAGIKTARGDVHMKWYYKGDTVYYEITVPKGTTATLTLPSGHTEALSGGAYLFSE